MGGDIDLYIETNLKDPEETHRKRIEFVCELQQTIGLQKIDVVLNRIGSGVDLPIYAVAKSEGVRLI